MAVVLRELGATLSELDFEMAGATERSVFRVAVGRQRARMLCDSYQGPLLVGDAQLLAAIEVRLREVQAERG